MCRGLLCAVPLRTNGQLEQALPELRGALHRCSLVRGQMFFLTSNLRYVLLVLEGVLLLRVVVVAYSRKGHQQRSVPVSVLIMCCAAGEMETATKACHALSCHDAPYPRDAAVTKRTVSTSFRTIRLSRRWHARDTERRVAGVGVLTLRALGLISWGRKEGAVRNPRALSSCSCSSS